MVSYKPLWHTLIDRDMKKMELVEKVGMSRATLSKLNNDQYVSLEVLDRICEVLGVPHSRCCKNRERRVIAMYEDILDRGIKRTIISFDPFLKRDDVKGLTDAQVGRRFGLETSTVKAMRLHQDVPFDTIQKICHALGCQPGDVLNATEVWTIPPTKKDPDD